MKRKRADAPPSRIYTYGCLAPISGAALVDEQLRLAHKYRNKLVEIEIPRLEKVRAAVAAVADVEPLDIETKRIDAELEAARLAVKAVRKEARRRSPVDETAKARIKSLVAQLKKSRDDLKAAKQRVKQDPELVAKIKVINDEAKAAVRAARAECGVYWGSYLLIEEAAQQARGSRRDPKFKGWDQGGRIGVQLQGGLPVSKVFGEDTRLRIRPVPPEAWTGTRGERRRLTQTEVMIRVGTTEGGRSPIWATFPCVLHRPLPPDGVIKLAWVKRQRIATQFRYELQINVEARSFVALAPASQAVAAIDVGWRAMDDELRVAYIVDDEGRKQDIRLPVEVKQKLEHADSLRSIRDRNFDELKSALVAWLATHEPPGWLKNRTANLGQWRSQRRLAGVVTLWIRERFAGDEAVFEMARAWCKQDRHLYDWEANERDNALAQRKDFYCNVAADVSRRYGFVKLERFDLRKLIRRGKPEGEADAPQAQRHNRHVVSVSEFRGVLKSACLSRGVKIIEVPAPWTTIECHKCGCVEPWDAAPKVDHRCVQCGIEWDQDYNAAVNILRREPEEPKEKEEDGSSDSVATSARSRSQFEN